MLEKAYKQAVDLFQSMTPAGRITTALLLAVVVLGLAFLFRFESSDASEPLLGGREFSKNELANMEAAFGKAELNDYQVDGYRVSVPSGKKSLYMAALADGNALPENFTKPLVDALTSNSLFPLPRRVLEERIKYAKEQNLSLIISRMKDVEDARVQFETEEGSGLRRTTKTRAVAAVKLVASPEFVDERVSAIRNTVVAGVAGLKPEDVTVTDWESGRCYPGTAADAHQEIYTSAYLKLKRHHEKDFRDNILNVLRDYPGVVVGVHVDLHNLVDHQTPSQNAYSATLTPTSKVDGGSSTSKNMWVPRRVTATIGVPKSYYMKVWHERHSETDAQAHPKAADIITIETDTKKTIHDSVVNVLPRNLGGDPHDYIKIVTNEVLSSTDSMPEPSLTETATTWLAGNWRTVAMACLGIFGLLMFRGAIRSVPSDSSPGEANSQPVPATTIARQTAPAPDEGYAVQAPHPTISRPDANRHDKLTQLINDDPEAAANVLRNWIGDAA